MDTKSDYKQAILGFLQEQFGAEPDEVDPETSLVDQGVIDSIGLIDICAFMERTWRIPVEGRDMTRVNFGSLSRMADYVERRLSTRVEEPEDGVV